MSALETKVVEIVRTVIDLSLDNLGPEDNLVEIGVNSLNFIKIVVALEKEFCVDFEDEMIDLSDYATIGDLANITQRLVEQVK